MPPRARAQVLPTHNAQLFETAVQRAVQLLISGEVVAVPTETVYGLAANALDPAAVARIFEIKGRPTHNPIIVHVAGLEMARRCAADWPLIADKLARAFWPGPLTIVLPRSPEIPNIVTAGGETVGIRWPSHPFIQEVIRKCDFPIAAPSANPSNQVSPTNSSHVLKSLGDRIPLIVDGGQSQVGIESTVLDLSVRPPRLLRPGMISRETLLTVTDEIVVAEDGLRQILKSPGQLPRHYSPKARLAILSWRDDEDLKSQSARFKVKSSALHIISHTRIPSSEGFGRVSVIPHDSEAFARAIYSELHQCDDAGAQLIIVEALPESSEWGAIRDRLTRASAS